MKSCREVMIPFIQRYYDFMEHDLISMMARYTHQTFLDIKGRLRLPFDSEDMEFVELVVTDLHEYIEAAEMMVKIGKVIPIDHRSKEWQEAYKIAHPVAVKLEAQFYREKGWHDLAQKTLSGEMMVFK